MSPSKQINCVFLGKRKQEENRKWKNRAAKGSRKQTGKEIRKEKRKIEWRRQSEIKLHETKFYRNKQNEQHTKNRNSGRNKSRLHKEGR